MAPRVSISSNVSSKDKRPTKADFIWASKYTNWIPEIPYDAKFLPSHTQSFPTDSPKMRLPLVLFIIFHSTCYHCRIVKTANQSNVWPPNIKPNNIVPVSNSTVDSNVSTTEENVTSTASPAPTPLRPSHNGRQNMDKPRKSLIETNVTREKVHYIKGMDWKDFDNRSVETVLYIWITFIILFLIIGLFCICAIRYYYSWKTDKHLDEIRKECEEHRQINFINSNINDNPDPLSPPVTGQEVYYPLGNLLREDAVVSVL